MNDLGMSLALGVLGQDEETADNTGDAILRPDGTSHVKREDGTSDILRP